MGRWRRCLGTTWATDENRIGRHVDKRERSDAQDGKEAEGHGSVCLTVWLFERSHLCPGGFGGGEEVRVEQHAHLLPTKPPHTPLSRTPKTRSKSNWIRFKATKALDSQQEHGRATWPAPWRRMGRCVRTHAPPPRAPCSRARSPAPPAASASPAHGTAASPPEPTANMRSNFRGAGGTSPREHERAREGACQVRRTRAAGSAEASR